MLFGQSLHIQIDVIGQVAASTPVEEHIARYEAGRSS
jgi:hypothetical protein